AHRTGDRADDPVVHRREGAGPAEVLLMASPCRAAWASAAKRSRGWRYRARCSAERYDSDSCRFTDAARRGPIVVSSAPAVASMRARSSSANWSLEIGLLK